MKRLLYILVLLLCFSCAHEKNQVPMPVSEELKPDSYKYSEESIESDKKSVHNQSDVQQINRVIFIKQLLPTVSQKIQEGYDQSVLKNTHPEFQNESIKSSVFQISDSIQSVIIKDAAYISSASQIGEEVFTQQITYTKVLNEKFMEKDTVLAIIKLTPTHLNDTEVLSTSFSFQKLVP